MWNAFKQKQSPSWKFPTLMIWASVARHPHEPDHRAALPAKWSPPRLGTSRYPLPVGIFESMIFLDYRLVGYVIVPWKGSLFVGVYFLAIDSFWLMGIIYLYFFVYWSIVFFGCIFWILWDLRLFPKTRVGFQRSGNALWWACPWQPCQSPAKAMWSKSTTMSSWLWIWMTIPRRLMNSKKMTCTVLH